MTRVPREQVSLLTQQALEMVEKLQVQSASDGLVQGRPHDVVGLLNMIKHWIHLEPFLARDIVRTLGDEAAATIAEIEFEIGEKCGARAASGLDDD